jgi:hypothetical protein
VLDFVATGYYVYRQYGKAVIPGMSRYSNRAHFVCIFRAANVPTFSTTLCHFRCICVLPLDNLMKTCCMSLYPVAGACPQQSRDHKSVPDLVHYE